MIISVKKQGFFYVVQLDDGRILSVPDDIDNLDRQELQKWLDAGNTLEQAVSESSSNLPIYKWQELAIAFKSSYLDREIITPLKDAGTNPKSSVIWRICDDIQSVLTIPLFSEDVRVARLNELISQLFKELKNGEIVVPKESKQEIIQSLIDNGFEESAALLNL